MDTVFKGRIEKMQNSLKEEQQFVGGLITVVRLTEELDIVANDEGKLNRLPLNRAWLDSNGNILDILVGNIFVCRHDEEENFTAILEEDIPIVLDRLPAYGVQINSRVYGYRYDRKKEITVNEKDVRGRDPVLILSRKYHNKEKVQYNLWDRMLCIPTAMYLPMLLLLVLQKNFSLIIPWGVWILFYCIGVVLICTYLFGAVFDRSGVAAKEGLRLANCVSVCDEDYRGEYLVVLHNDSSETRVIAPGNKIAQLVVMPYLQIDLTETETLSETSRGSGGFGSTGA